MADAKKTTKATSTDNNNGKQRIRIRLKAYDHKVIDQSAKQIVETALRQKLPAQFHCLRVKVHLQ
jgi:ribosomal protein S10